MPQSPEWMTLTCGTCGKERQVKYRRYGVKRNQDCHSCAGKKNDPARWSTTHGDHDTKLYRMWCGMKNRCYTPSNRAYKYYGGKGVSVCDDWLDFSVFRDWSIANGYKLDAKMELHRRDSGNNYSPDNCVWMSQQQHRRMVPNSTLSLLDVAVIKRMLKDGFRSFQIAKVYDVNPCLISSINVGNTWNWVEVA
jgi:hypothetical protein